MTIPALPPLDRTSPTFRSDLDAFFLTQLPATVTALNAELTRIDGITPAGFTGTSGTSRTIASSGSFTFGVTSGTTRAFTPGQRLVIAATTAPSNQMRGYVTTYTPGTGELVVAVDESSGSGTFDLWSIAVTAPAASPHYVGDVLVTNRTLSSPSWLPADGAIYSQASYAALYAELGLLRDGVARLPFVAGGNLAQNAGVTTNNAEGFAPFPLAVFDGKFMVYNKTTGAGNSRLARSTDGGVTWAQATMPTTATDVAYTAIVSHNSGTTLVATHGSTDAWVARSTDSGATWATAGVAGYAGGGQLFTLNGGYVLILNTAASAWTSPDGAAWTSRTLPATLSVRAVLTYQGQQVAVAAGAAPWTTLYTSTDAITWTSRSVPSMANVFLGGPPASLNDVFVWVPTSTDTTYRRSTDGGATWAAITLPHVINLPAYAVSTVRLQVFKGRFVYLSLIAGENVLVSSADGLTWRIDTTPISGDDVSNIGYLRATENELWLVDTAASTAGIAYCLTDWAGSWLPTVSAETTANSDDMLITLAETGGVQVYLPGGTSQTRRRPVYTYNSATQFAVPAVPTPTGVTAYIKA